MFFPVPPPKGTVPPDDLLEWDAPLARAPWWTWAGLLIILLSEILLIFKVEPVYSHFTLIVWWGYILLLDGLIKHRRGISFLADKPKVFVFLSLLSAFWWLVFEFYNCYLENWVYIGVPDNIIHRYLCYVLAFATIVPAILQTYEAFLTFWPAQETLDFTKHPSRWTVCLWFGFGVCFVTLPLLVPVREVRHYLFGFVWMGYVFMLEPLAYWAGGYSLLRLWAAGCRRAVWLMFGAGAWCGLLWEFWNYWAGAKWLYTVPVLPSIRYFEMPVIGFLGFLPFAWECLVLSVFTSLIVGRPVIGAQLNSFSSRMVWISRGLFAGLLGVFILTYFVQPKWCFPIRAMLQTCSMDDVLQWEIGKQPAVRFVERWEQLDRTNPEESFSQMKNFSTSSDGTFWFPWTASREHLMTVGRFQKYPRWSRHIDPLLREYAVRSRFLWANVFPENANLDSS